MKTSGWVATAAGAVVVVGGGIFAVQALTADPGGHTEFRDDTETAYTGAYEPAITETPEPVETATAEPDETVEPAPEETVTPEFTEPEQVFLDWARPIYEFNRSTATRLPEMSDQDLLGALSKACEVGGDESLGLSVIPGFDSADDFDPNTWEDDANAMFFGAARVGDGAGMSYCG